jgi:hypothetical protein
MVNHHIYILSRVKILKKRNSVWNPLHFEWRLLVGEACCLSGGLLSSLLGIINCSLLGGHL